eukprot:jgi/Chlat1/1169/Chrsp113S08650
MNKFNAIQRNRRQERRKHKREQVGDKGRLAAEASKAGVSGARTGKHARKLLRQYRRAQKEVVERGLITQQDVDMLLADNAGEEAASASAVNETKATKSVVKQGVRIGRRVRVVVPKSKRRAVTGKIGTEEAGQQQQVEAMATG